MEKDYVFVDEHNRHKRLKGRTLMLPKFPWTMLIATVMRACEGCRRRKIKCDAATSNQWPCAACVRLKLHCVPPTANYDRVPNGGHLAGLERVLDFDASSGSGEDDYHAQTSVPQYYDSMSNTHDMDPRQGSFNDGMGAFHTPPYSERAPSLNGAYYDEVPGMQLRVDQSFQEPGSYAQMNGAPITTGQNGTVWNNEQLSAAELSDVLGELKINENGEGVLSRTAKDMQSLILCSAVYLPAKEKLGRGTGSRGI